MKKSAIAALVLAATAVPVVAQQMKAEDQIKYRKSAYALLGLNFGNLAAMVTDKKPYNQAEAARNAEFVALLATVPKGYFGEGTHENTKAKPDIWKNRADFDSKMDKMVKEAGELPAAVKAGDMASLKKHVADTNAACKACHDDYRLK